MLLGGMGLFESSRVYLFWLVGMGRLGCFSFGLLISRVLLGAGGMGLESFIAMFGELLMCFLRNRNVEVVLPWVWTNGLFFPLH